MVATVTSLLHLFSRILVSIRELHGSIGRWYLSLSPSSQNCVKPNSSLCSNKSPEQRTWIVEETTCEDDAVEVLKQLKWEALLCDEESIDAKVKKIQMLRIHKQH